MRRDLISMELKRRDDSEVDQSSPHKKHKTYRAGGSAGGETWIG